MIAEPLLVGLLCHLAGDYLIQTDRMANRKTESWPWALAHAVAYTLPFLLITRSVVALLVIGGTHAVIDHYRLAKHFIWLKERLTGGLRRSDTERDQVAADMLGVELPPTYTWAECRKFGFVPTKPDYMAFWLMVIVDNSIHLIINSMAISWA